MLACLLLPVLAVVLYSATGGDDAHIAWWSAFSLSEWGEFQQYGGERVEQGSSLLHVLLLALLRKLTHLPMPLLGIGSSLVFGGVTVGVAALLGRHLVGRKEVGWAAALLTATCFPLTYWSVSGLDTSLAAFAFTWMLLACIRYLNGEGKVGFAGLSILLVLTARPEGFFVVMAILLLVGFVQLRKRKDSGSVAFRRTLMLLVIAVVVFAALCLWRWIYFGRLFPEPVYVKAAGITWYKTKQGIKYLLRYAIHPMMWVWTLGWLAAAWRMRKQGGGGAALPMLVGAVLAVLGFVVLTGGDWMENARYLAPMLPIVMAMVATLLPAERRLGNLVLAGTLTAQVAALLVTAALFSRGRPLWTLSKVSVSPAVASHFHPLQLACKDGKRDAAFALELEEIYGKVRAAKGDTVNVMSGQGGMVIYHLAQRHPHAFRWVDIWGLSDRSVADCPPTRTVQLIPIPTWSWEKFFELLPTIRRECPTFPEPDIICELDDVRYMPPLLERHGYRLVFEQEGILVSGDPLFPGLQLNAGQVIAVKADLAEKAGLTTVEYYHMGEE
jgi:hypothetical protein